MRQHPGPVEMADLEELKATIDANFKVRSEETAQLRVEVAHVKTVIDHMGHDMANLSRVLVTALGISKEDADRGAVKFAREHYTLVRFVEKLVQLGFALLAAAVLGVSAVVWQTVQSGIRGG